MAMCVVRTPAGAVRGVVEEGIARFLGIPFAAPPFGSRRFGLPEPHAPWEGERDATRYGPTPPQTPYQGGLERVLTSVAVPGEDILNLNVWTPVSALENGRPLPVLFWIYGGALTRGCNALAIYDGTSFARDGLVFVGVNYRVGVEGFGELDGAPNNRGLADLVAGLEWVRDSIPAFGGNPADVTIIGQSAGGAMVSLLLSSPRAEGLFSKAVVMSAAMGPAPARPPGGAAAGIAEQLGIPRTRDAFAGVPADELAEAQTRAMAGGSIITGGAGYRPIPGDDLLPVDAWTAFQRGHGGSVPVLIGCTTEEHRLWYLPTGLESSITPEQIAAGLAALGISRETFDLYRRNRPGDSEAMAFGGVLLDRICRIGMNRFADLRLAQGAPTWAYEFAWRSPVLDLRAAHAVDLPFLFDELSIDDATRLVGTGAPRQVADDFHGAVVRLARGGDPGWEAWNAKRPVMTFDTPAASVVHAPREAERIALTPG